MAVVRELPDFQVADIWTWREWPDRWRLTGLDGRDTGIDLVAKLTNGSLVAVQCKCYDAGNRVSKPDVDSFISASDGDAFDLRWVVSTCAWNANAESAIRNKRPEVRRIDFLDQELRPWPEMDQCPVRAELDAVVGGAVGLGPDQVAEWRRKLVLEPTISNKARTVDP